MRRPAGPLSDAEARGDGAGAEPAAGIEGTWRLKRVGLFLLMALLLGTATAALQLGPWRYRPAPGAAPAIDGFADTSAGPWFLSRQRAAIDQDGGQPAITLTGGRGIAYAAHWIKRTPGIDFTRVSLDVAIDGIDPGRRNIGGVIQVASFDHLGRRLTYWPRDLFDGTGTRAWQRASLVVPWAEEVATMRLEIFQAGTSGRLQVRGVEIAPLVEAPWYQPARVALIALWVALGLAMVVAAMRLATPRPAALVVIAAAAFVMLGGLMPEPLFHQLTAPVEAPLQVAGRAMVGPPPAPRERRTTAPAIPSVEADRPAAAAVVEHRPPAMASTLAPPTGGDEMSELTREGTLWLRRAFGRNIMHMVGFGGIAALAAFVAPPVGLAHIAALAGFAGVTETLQLFTITREATLEDVAIDLMSGLAGLAAGAIARRLGVSRWLAGIRNSVRPARPPAG